MNFELSITLLTSLYHRFEQNRPGDGGVAQHLGVTAAILALYMTRALNAFELESQRRLEEANQAKLSVQAATLEAERRISREMERLNEELRLTAHELSLLLAALIVPFALLASASAQELPARLSFQC